MKPPAREDPSPPSPFFWDIRIGMEVHAQLDTRTKLFCRCPNRFGDPPNTLVCPVCLGLPGVLPAPNAKAVELVVKTGLALGCRIAEESRFARKNYFYPDLPKNYQISQYEIPLCEGGAVEIEQDGKKKQIRLRRIHLEEDAGKLVHLPSGEAGVDFNRAGVPLMEIVTEPDLTSVEEAVAYLSELKAVLEYVEASRADMEKGNLRCEPNVSLTPAGSKTLGQKVELKNINSLRAVRSAIAYEVQRQRQVLEGGGEVRQETRRWDEAAQRTVSMRGKEEASDYRYFPDPDLLPLRIAPDRIRAIAQGLPELPASKRRRFQQALGLSPYQAQVLTGQRSLAEFFEETASLTGDAKRAANWIMNEMLKLMHEERMEAGQLKIAPADLADLFSLCDAGTISGKQAKEVFAAMFRGGRRARDVVEAEGIRQISDDGLLDGVVEEVVSENPDVVAKVLAGEERAFGFLMGQVMRKTGGKANPRAARKRLQRKLREREKIG